MSWKNVVLLQLCPKMLSTNQIAIFFDHQYPWKESVDIIDFLRGNNHQGEIGDETSAFGWVWPVVPLFQSNQIVGFYDHQYLWKESSEILVFCM